MSTLDDLKAAIVTGALLSVLVVVFMLWHAGRTDKVVEHQTRNWSELSAPASPAACR